MGAKQGTTAILWAATNGRSDEQEGEGKQVKRGRWEKTGMWGRWEMSGTFVWGRPCTRKSGGSDPPCGRNSEKGEDDVEDR